MAEAAHRSFRSWATRRISEEMDLPNHFFSGLFSPEGNEPMNDLANSAVSLVAVGNPRVFNASTG